MKFIKVSGKLVQLDDTKPTKKRRGGMECIELYRVWVAFGVGLFIGGVVGVVAMCILNMARS